MDFTIPEELEMLRRSVRRFVQDRLIPLEGQILAREEAAKKGGRLLPEGKAEELRRVVMQMGLWAITVPEEFGGGGLDTLGSCLVVGEMARSFTPSDFGDVNPIFFECDHEQKERFLLPIVMGEVQPCFALREPQAGVNVEAFETIATKDDDTYLLNGRKLVLLRGASLDFAAVFAITDREKGRREGVSCFLVEERTPGLTLHHDGSDGEIELVLRDCQVPTANVLGEIGQGLSLGRRWFPGRQMTAAARYLGAAERILEMSTLRAQLWQAFGRPVAQRKALHAMLAEMATDIHAARLMIYHGAWRVDQGIKDLQDVAMIKLFTTQMLSRAVGRAIRIHSGPGGAEESIIRALYRNAASSGATEETLAKHRAFVASRFLDLADSL
jgi:alkylation response protein AidB-like acyl-CoA dehydrogenase